MKLSIIVPTYNIEKYLAETLDCVLAQTYSDWEVILVDDGSSDGTVRVAQEYVRRDPRFRVLQQQNSGGAAARDRGFAEADPNSEAVLFLDHDDLLEPEALEILAGGLEAHPEAVAAYGLARYIDGQGHLIRQGEMERWIRHRKTIVGNRLTDVPLDQPTTYANLAFANCIGISGILMRRTAKAAAGPFDPVCSHCHDWDMWLRISMSGDIIYIDRLVYRYRQHESNMSGSGRQIILSDRVVRRKFATSPEISPEHRRIMRLASLYHERYVCALRWGWARENIQQRQWKQAAVNAGHAVRNYLRGFQVSVF